QVLGHGGGERFAADHHRHLFGIARKIDGGLAGGLGAADEVDGLAFARHGFGYAAAVVDACTAEAVFTGDAETAPLDPHGEEQCMAGDFTAVGHFDNSVGPFNAYTGS